jgi:hypothetical protein
MKILLGFMIIKMIFLTKKLQRVFHLIQFSEEFVTVE